MVALHHAEQQRVDWIKHNSYSQLDNDLLREMEKYDQWSQKQQSRLATRSGSSSFHIDEDPLYQSNPNFRRMGIRLSELLPGRRVLEIGGSCIDSWRFLLAGADEVHQVEVSPGSQRLGLARVQSKATPADNITSKVMFHTSPAEYLPFKDNSFDLVFSRSSVHHTNRSLSIKEIARVLKLDGTLLLFEPLQTQVNNSLMHAARLIRKADRGTDDPLTSRDIKLLRESFSVVRVSPNTIFSYDAKKTASWLLRRRKPAIPVILAQKPLHP